MLWDLLALLGVVFGFLLIVGGLDTLVAWRAWFLGMSGLVLFLPGIIRIFLRSRRLLTRNGSMEDNN